jgi:hypothetical protein
LLAFDASVLSTVTLSDVPAGTVTSRNAGAGGGSGGAGGDGGTGAAPDGCPEAGLDEGAAAGGGVPPGLVSGVAAGAAFGGCGWAAGAAAGADWPAGADSGGFDGEHAIARHVATVSIRIGLVICSSPRSSYTLFPRRRHARPAGS